MQHIDLLRSLALSSALILALGGISTADDKDTSDHLAKAASFGELAAGTQLEKGDPLFQRIEL